MLQMKCVTLVIMALTANLRCPPIKFVFIDI